jgi:hypothetical protein
MISYFYSVLGNFDHVVARVAVSKGIADGIPYHETNAVVIKIKIFMGVARENSRDSVFLEDGKIPISLLNREVGVVVRLVNRLAENRAMEENEYVSAFARGGKF